MTDQQYGNEKSQNLKISVNQTVSSGSNEQYDRLILNTVTVKTKHPQRSIEHLQKERAMSNQPLFSFDNSLYLT